MYRDMYPGSKWVAYDPNPDLLRASVAVTRQMQRLAIPTATRAPVKKVAPPGRLHGRSLVQAAGLRSVGNDRAADRVPLFRGVSTVRTSRPPAIVGIMADVSGSMRWSTTGVGEAAWLLARGAAHAGARVASVVFGEGVDPVVFPGDIPQRIIVRSASDSTESPDLALAALDGGLNLSYRTASGVPASRIVVIRSDMCWRPEQVRAFSVRARALSVSGVRFIVLGLPGATRRRGRHPGLPRIESPIADALGLWTPTPAPLLDLFHRDRGMYEPVLLEWFRGHPREGWESHDPAPLTLEEQHARPEDSRLHLPPMVAIEKELLADHRIRSTGYDSRYQSANVRDQIIFHTLAALEGLE